MSDQTNNPWVQACAEGSDQFHDLCRDMAREQNPLLMVAALREMSERGVWGGREVGFATRIACRLIAASA